MTLFQTILNGLVRSGCVLNNTWFWPRVVVFKIILSGLVRSDYISNNTLS